MKLNERLKLSRTEKGFTQQEIAEILHVSRATVSSWEVGRTLPSLEMVVDLSNIYDLSLDVLLKEDTTMVNQVGKELKTKKIYKAIAIATGIIIAIFILINCIWLISLKNQYSYLEKNWELDGKNYNYKKGNLSMSAPALNLKDEFRFHYLSPNPLYVSVSIPDKKNEDGFSLNVTAWNIKDVTAMVPKNKKESAFGFVNIDKNGQLSLEGNSHLNMWGEDIKIIESYLERNNEEIKQLYALSMEQFKLINKISR